MLPSTTSSIVEREQIETTTATNGHIPLRFATPATSRHKVGEREANDSAVTIRRRNDQQQQRDG